MTSIESLNRMSEAQFCAALDGLFEQSPWVVARAAARRPFASHQALLEACQAVVQQADGEQQLALLRAHPPLGIRAGEPAALTGASRSEQARAGLDRCTPEQFARLRQLNAAYNERFGFPFILAVRGHTPTSVIAALEQRVTHELHQERGQALRQVCQIAAYRFQDRVGIT